MSARDLRRCCRSRRGKDVPHVDGCEVAALHARRRDCCGTTPGRRQPHRPDCPNEAERLRSLDDPRGTPDTTPDWSAKCQVCDASPVMPATGMCGPCTTGEADTIGGNW